MHINFHVQITKVSVAHRADSHLPSYPNDLDSCCWTYWVKRTDQVGSSTHHVSVGWCGGCELTAQQGAQVTAVHFDTKIMMVCKCWYVGFFHDWKVVGWWIAWIEM